MTGPIRPRQYLEMIGAAVGVTVAELLASAPGRKGGKTRGPGICTVCHTPHEGVAAAYMSRCGSCGLRAVWGWAAIAVGDRPTITIYGIDEAHPIVPHKASEPRRSS